MKRSSYEQLEREVPSQESIGVLNAALKHEEEVEKHIERNSLSIGDGALYIWSRGSQGQKVGMIRRLEKNIGDFEDRKITQLLGELRDAMWSQDLEIQLATSETMNTLLKGFSEPQQLIVLAMCAAMLSVSSQEVRAGWNATALELIHVLPRPLLLSEMVPIMHKKSEHSEPGDQRVLCTQLVGALCNRLEQATVVSTILPKALSLCQDTDIKIRAAMCSQLFTIAQAVGVQVAKEKLAVELFELLDDEDKLVSRAAFSCLIDMVDYFDVVYRKEHFYPIIRTYLANPPSAILSLLASEIGRFLVKIRVDIQGTDDVNLCASFFRQAASHSDPEVRRSAAFNLPAVVMCLPPSTYASHLYHATKLLAGDSHMPVRRAVAAGLHEVTHLLGDKAALFLKDPFSLLIQDPDNEVRRYIMRNLDAHMSLFAAQLKGEDKDNFFNGIVGGLVSYAQYYERRDWRKMASLVDAMKPFPNYFAPMTLYDRFIPILMGYIRNGATCLRLKCCELLVSFTRALAVPQIIDIFNRIGSDLRRSTSCYHRAAYLMVFSCATGEFSRKFLRERCVESVAELTKDVTPMVRTELAKALPAWRRILRGGSDSQLTEAYTTAAQRLLMDEDEYVRGAARVSVDAIKSMEADWSRGNRTGDAEDCSREAQEGNLTEVVKEQKTSERRHKLKELLRENELEGPIRRVPSNQSKPSMLRVPTGSHSVPASKYSTVSAVGSKPASSSSIGAKYGAGIAPSSTRSKSNVGGSSSGAVPSRPKR